jgi:hypothetical protein
VSLLDIVGGWLGNHAQQQQTQKGIDATNNLYGQARDSTYQWQQQGAQAQQPYMGLGSNAVGSLNQLFGYGTGANGANGAPNYSAFHADPGYQFQLNQGVAANNASFAARGMSDSGAQQKALAQYTSGLADQTYGNYVNRLMGLVGVGQNATNTLGAQNLGYAGVLNSMAGNQAQLLNSAYGTLGEQKAQMWGGITNGINNSVQQVLSGFGG